MAPTRIRTRILILVAVLSLPLITVEIAGRFFIRSDPNCPSGRLGRLCLAPRQLLSNTIPLPDPDRPLSPPPRADIRLTRGDLYGIHVTDPQLGWTAAPNRSSRNDWWQSNALGARLDRPIPQSVPEGKHRIVVLGGSMANSLCVPSEDGWTQSLARLRPDLEPYTFGVAGHSLAQAWVIYERIRPQIEMDSVIYVLEPDSIWREENSLRSILGTKVDFLAPTLGASGEVLLPPLLEPMARSEEGDEGRSARVRDHLARNDRFFLPTLHEPNPCSEWSLLCRVLLGQLGHLQLQEIKADAQRPEGRTWRKTRALLARATRENEKRGIGTSLLLLPAVIKPTKLESEEFLGPWTAIVESLEADGIRVIDARPFLVELGNRGDFGADGSHYGPTSNAAVARAVAAAFPRAAPVPSPQSTQPLRRGRVGRRKPPRGQVWG